jgi:ferredoxin
MKVIVDYDRCEANAVCMQICGGVRARDDDTLHLLVEEPTRACAPR